MKSAKHRLPWVSLGLFVGIGLAFFVRAFVSSVVSQVYAEAGAATFTGSTASFSASFTQAGNQPIRTAFGPLRFDYKSGPNAWTTGLLIREGDGNVTIGAGITSADFNSQSKLRVLGIVESTTGGFKFPDGSTQTSAAAGNVSGWTDGGTNVYLTTGTDSVGIGTTSPAQKLDVNGYIQVESTNGEGGTIKLIGNNGTNMHVENINGDFRLVNSPWNAELFRVTQAGNVGIGTTGPGAKLEVAGNINSSTGALQTGGVTRIANDGVGTFAAGTTIGGAGIPGGSGLNSVQTFAATGTWTKPAGVTKVIVEVQGGGGGGGGGNGIYDGSVAGGAGGSGGAGGYCRKFIDVSAISSVTVTVGAAGSAGSAGHNGLVSGSGGTGGTSSFGAHCSATGGSGGGPGVRAYNGGGGGGRGTGGAGSGGDINLTGNVGFPGKTAGNGGTEGGTGLKGILNGDAGDGGAGSWSTWGSAGSAGTAGNVVVWEYK